jgi:ferredoxin
MRVWIDQDYCTGSGLCELIEPRVFAIGDNGLARVRAAEVPPGCEDEVRDAAESCPGGCIRLEPRPLSRTYASFLPAPRKPADRGNDGPRSRLFSWTAVAPFTLAFIVLIVLAIANLGGTASWTADVAKVGGWFALLDSFAAGCLGAAIVLNVSMGKEHLPLFPTKLGKA